ncbi:Formyl-coenzyme A transferase [Variovorax boronicumulans]|uniref:CaiB/BaiF CoA transferase family protein n=1 Tax=Variovorax boronicumulans TaxID=436515 RepID=UPI000BB38471|nr:CaiB/BaiF CoA-transferase family protein [Variovorax boronicumulans]PBI95792.1 Formyl-coenzyme A transferase [Variovorax boronicumulans]
MTNLPSNDAGRLPLSGVRVLDLTRVLAGPLCSMVLGDMGAEVIKIEHPERGDDTRDWGVRAGGAETTYFNSANRNKRSVTVDLQTAKGQALVRQLATQCDVVLQNFKYGGVEKMGLGYEQINALKPDVIYCSISGYDRHGPERDRPGYDLVVQGEAGLMSINGEASQDPLKFGVAVVDIMTGMYSAQAVLAALYDRQRSGRGRHLEMALFDCGLMISVYYGLDALLMKKDPERFGNQHPSIVPYGVFEAQDGPLIIAVGNSAQFDRFCAEVIERPDLLADERFSTNVRRTENREALVPELRKEIRSRTRGVLLERLSAVGIPCGEVLGLYDALTSPRVERSGLVTRQPHPTVGHTDVMAPPYRFDGERLPVRRPPPQLGESTRGVLSDMLGLDAGQIELLQSEGVI